MVLFKNLIKKRNFLEDENMEKNLNEFYTNKFLIIKLEDILNK